MNNVLMQLSYWITIRKLESLSLANYSLAHWQIIIFILSYPQKKLHLLSKWKN
jgi:hypothetical protein